MECEAEVPEQINIDMGDLGVIIGNLLDNSIKAVNNISTDDQGAIITTEFKRLSLKANLERKYIRKCISDEDKHIVNIIYY